MNKMLMMGLVLTLSSAAMAQEVPDVIKLEQYNGIKRKEILIPNIPGYVSLKCELHAHTIFSDGDVHPVVRMDEAWADGLDAIAITDHLEYLKYKKYITSSHDDSYLLAKPRAEKLGLMLIKGCEITRQKPFGHMNALFISNADSIYDAKPERSVEKALAQGAFIMWNHPGWPDDKSTMTEMHRSYLDAKAIRGIEVFNSKEYYPPVLDWCKTYKASYLATTDIHGLTHLDYYGDIRPMTIVVAKEKSLEGIKEALMEGRTLAWFDNTLAGNEKLLTDFFHACITSTPIKGKNKALESRELTNQSSIPIRISNGTQQLTIEPLSAINVQFKKGDTWKVVNFWEVYKQPIEVVIR